MGRFLADAIDVRLLGFGVTAAGLLLLTLGLGLGVGGELAGFDGETRLTGLSGGCALLITLAVLALTDALLPALAVGAVLSVGAEYVLGRH